MAVTARKRAHQFFMCHKEFVMVGRLCVAT